MFLDLGASLAPLILTSFDLKYRGLKFFNKLRSPTKNIFGTVMMLTALFFCIREGFAAMPKKAISKFKGFWINSISKLYVNGTIVEFMTSKQEINIYTKKLKTTTLTTKNPSFSQILLRSSIKAFYRGKNILSYD
uniref:Uncharacterized protein n=1 Tax=Glossina pallidipes TaxID=7398 RepID=A0A1B0A021_GLOPL